MVKYGVLFEVRTEFLNIIKASFGFKKFLLRKLWWSASRQKKFSRAGAEDVIFWGGGDRGGGDVLKWNGSRSRQSKETITIERSARPNVIGNGRHHCTANWGSCSQCSLQWNSICQSIIASWHRTISTVKMNLFVFSHCVFLCLSRILHILRPCSPLGLPGNIPEEMASYFPKCLQMLFSFVIYFCDKKIKL
jgi:hypothetical protein